VTSCPVRPPDGCPRPPHRRRRPAAASRPSPCTAAARQYPLGASPSIRWCRSGWGTARRRLPHRDERRAVVDGLPHRAREPQDARSGRRRSVWGPAGFTKDTLDQYHRRASTRVGPRATVIREPRQARKGATVSGLPVCREPPGPRPGLSFCDAESDYGSSRRSARSARGDEWIPSSRRRPRFRALRTIIDTHDGLIGAARRARPTGLPRSNVTARLRLAREVERGRIDALERVAHVELPRVGFVRYNAFSDVGSDLSYAWPVESRRRRCGAEQHLLARGHAHVRQGRVRVQAGPGSVGRRARRYRQGTVGDLVNGVNKTFLDQDHPARRVQRLQGRVHAAPSRGAGGGNLDRAARARGSIRTSCTSPRERSRAAGADRRAADEARDDRPSSRRAREPAQSRSARERHIKRMIGADRGEHNQHARPGRQRPGPAGLRDRADALAQPRARSAVTRDDARRVELLAMRVLNLRRLASIAHERFLRDPVAQPGRRRNRAGYGWRTNPWPEFHKGVDLAANYGDQVRAAAAGTVVSAGWDPGGSGSKSTSTTATVTTPVRAPVRARPWDPASAS